jgi:catechol 2,3-dioxygenase-like lactoylglutathione lyase family enzyme
MIETTPARYDVGGVQLERPFKIRRLGHFGFNTDRMDEAVRFYHELFGLHVSDRLDLSKQAKDPAEIAGFGDPNAYFMRHGTDHHSFVLFNRRVREALNKSRPVVPGVTVNQMSWQVGSLEEVARGYDWFAAQGIPIQRIGRDWPGSNWNQHIYDPDGYHNELYYGMEQIGWAGESKPPAMHARRFTGRPEIPWMSEEDEIREALAHGVDLFTGSQRREELPRTYDVEGQMLARPFRVTKVGPIRLFVKDVGASSHYYQDRLGLTVTDELDWNGFRCVFLRANTEHHAMGLYPLALRAQLGLSEHTTCMSFGFQVATYRQLCDARTFFREHGVRLIDIPSELHPGIDYAFHVVDPDGHVLQVYFAMEQIGWDGTPRPAAARPRVDPRAWPETLDAQPEFYAGEIFLGPLG